MLFRSIGSHADPKTKLTPTQTSEVGQLFRLIVPNVAKAVLADVRAFLERFAE